MKYPKQFSKVTVVDNKTGEETTGSILMYTPHVIILRDKVYFEGSGKVCEIKETRFDAQQVHFKGDK